jgi:hypothetical protein
LARTAGDDEHPGSAWDGTLENFVVHAACKQSSRTPDASSSHLLRAFRDAKFVLINQLSFSDITHSTT